jgi:PTS system nitrogen regulatory IIA component
MVKRTKRREPEEVLMTLADVAVYLQIAERTVYQWAQRSQIPSFKLGNVWRFKRSDLEKWIENRKLETPRNAQAAKPAKA